MKNNSGFVLLVKQCVHDKERIRKMAKEAKCNIFTNLRTLSHLLTFSYDVVSHDDERRVSLWGWNERRHLFIFFTASDSKMPLCCEMTCWETLLLCNMAKLTAGGQSKHFESWSDLPRNTFKKVKSIFTNTHIVLHTVAFQEKGKMWLIQRNCFALLHSP